MLKKKDLLILSYLRRNARASLVDIARKTSIPVSTVYDKLKSFAGKQVKKHTSLVDFTKLGFAIRASALFKVNDKHGFRDFLNKNVNVNSACIVNGDFDFWVDCVFRDMSELQEFISNTRAFDIQKKQINFINAELKREAFLEDKTYLKKILEDE